MPQILGKEVGKIGFGLMGFTWRPNPCPEEQAFAAMREALAQGAIFWNGGEFYGTPEYNSMTLLRRYFDKYPDDADKVIISFKGALDMATLRPDSSPEAVRASVRNILAQLGQPGGPARCDVFECGRRDRSVPLEATFGTLRREFVEPGLIGGVSLSEVSAATIHEAVKVIKVAFVEVELSLWATDVLTNGIAAACAQYEIPLVAYSPLGRGMLTGQIRSPADIPDGDFRQRLPRFQPDAFDINLQLVDQIVAIATRKGCTPAQLALGWCLALQRRPGMPVIIPIPGATTAERVRENCAPAELSDSEMAEIDATLDKFEVVGDRYQEGAATNT